MPARSKQVVVNGKNIVVTEKKIKEIEGLLSGFKNPFADLTEQKKQEVLAKAAEEGKTLTDAEVTQQASAEVSVEDMKNIGLGTLKDKLTEIVPGLTQDDINESYPSEIEDLIGAIVEVNFTGAKKVAGLFMTYVRGLFPQK
jgi:hypothetical protein